MFVSLRTLFLFNSYAIGFFGNILSLIVFISGKKFRNNSTGVLFLLMTISNSIHLWTLTTEFLNAFSVYIYPNEFFQCRLNFFIQNLSRAVSTYLATTVALDRFIRSELPIRSRVICTKRNSIKLTILYLIIYSILFSFWFCPLNSINPLTKACYIGQSLIYNYFIYKIYFPLRFILVYAIPALIMIAANSRVIYNIRKSRRRIVQSQQIGVSITRVQNSTISILTTSFDKMLFRMMVANVTTFVITQLPFHVYCITEISYFPSDYFLYASIRTILLIWSSVFFGIAFYLYCLTSPFYRQQFIKIFKRIFRCIRRP